MEGTGEGCGFFCSPKLPYLSTHLRQLPDSPYPDMSNIHIDNNGVIKLLSGLNTSKANGPDLLPTHVLKEAATEIAPYLSFIFQQSINTGLEGCQCCSNIEESFKVRGCLLHVRLVNVSAMQAVRTYYLSQYYDTFKLFQHPGGCPTWFPSWELMRNATYQYHGASNQVRNDRNQTDLLILDFSKAFDKVAHKRPLLKLQYYGIHGLVLAWIKAWLIGRTQKVALKGEISEKSCVRSGVPQGTGLGPLCFLLFLHDIGNDITSNIKLFVDDTLLYGLVHNSHDAISLTVSI